MNPNSTDKSISFLSDGYLLKGTLHLPAQSAPPVVVGSHGLLSSGDSPKQQALADACNRAGLAFFRFDHRGCGRSQGFLPEVASLEARSGDLLNAVALMRRRRDTGAVIGLFGSSMGGATCLNVARRAGADAVVTVAAPLRSATLNRDAGRLNLRDPAWFDKMAARLVFDVSERLEALGRILIFHGDADEVVPFSNAIELYDRTHSPKKLIRQPSGDHLMSDPDHQRTFIRESADWFAAHLGARPEQRPEATATGC
jgi:alpha-beta hydrolase superfamily lysophospholipase